MEAYMAMGITFSRETAKEDFRRIMEYSDKSLPKEPMMKYVNDCVREEVKINGKEFFPNSGSDIKAFVIKVAGKEAINRPCLVYFHGGAAIAGTAE